GIQHFDIERDEYEALAHLVGPLRGENERAALPLDLSDPSLPLFLITPWMAEPELRHVEIDRSVDVRHEQHRPRKPLVAHDVTPRVEIVGCSPLYSHSKSPAASLRYASRHSHGPEHQAIGLRDLNTILEQQFSSPQRQSPSTFS